MAVDTDKPILVSESAGGHDAASAALRYVTAILAAFPVILALLRDRDIVAIHSYFAGAEGATFMAAVVGLGTIAYGLYKTWRRGRQVVKIASDARVPTAVANLR